VAFVPTNSYRVAVHIRASRRTAKYTPKNVQDRDGGARDASNSVLMFDPNDAIRPGDPLSCDLYGRSIRAKLHRCMLDLFAASAKSESNDDCGENDCALHVIFS